MRLGRLLGSVAILAAGTSLAGCQALPAAAWAAIGAGFGACAAACPPAIALQKDVFDYYTGQDAAPPKPAEKPPAPAAIKPSA